MPARGAVELVIRFGPSSSPAFPAAVALARSHAEELTELGGGSVQARFHLGTEERAYGAAEQLTWMVGDWKATTCEVDRSPESRFAVLAMLSCGREWLRSTGRCAEAFSSPLGEQKCKCCPLFDPQWAVESAGAHRPGFLLTAGEDPIWLEVPDYPPEDWSEP